MPNASLRKKFRSFLDIREARELYDCSGSDDSLPFGLLSPLCPGLDQDDVTDVKSSSGDSNTLKRAFKRTLSWKKRKSQSPTSIDKLVSEEKLTSGEESCTIFIIGYSGVGKTAAVVRFLTGRYIHEYESTQEESYNRNINVDGTHIKVKLTSMTHKIKKYEEKFTQPCTGIILAYSVVDLLSFHYVESLLDNIRTSETPIILVGTKSDLEERRCICRETAEKLAHDKGCYYYECSAATNTGVGDCFKRLIKRSLRRGKDRSGSSMTEFDFSRTGRRRSSVS